MWLHRGMSKTIMIATVVALALGGVTDSFEWLIKSKDSGLVDNQLSATQNRVYGGREANPGGWPWQVAIYYSPIGTFGCGGSVLNSTFVLTAAHCCLNGNGEPEPLMHIVAGVHNRTENDPYWQERKVVRLFIHPEYSKDDHSYDIALLELGSALEFGPRVQPALLPQQGEELECGSNATVIGWGQTETNEPSDVLLEAEVPITDIKMCNIADDDEKAICAGAEGADACFGDSGGPLMAQKEDKRWYVYGIVSYGIGGECGVAGVYTKTSFFIDWINNIQATDVIPLIQNRSQNK